MDSLLISLKEAGRMLGYTGKSSGKTTMHKHCNEGRLVKVKIGGRSFVTKASVGDLVLSSRVTPLGRAFAKQDEHDRRLEAGEASGGR